LRGISYPAKNRREEGMATFTLHSPLLIIPTCLLLFLLLLFAYISPLTQNLLSLHRSSSSTSPQLLSPAPAPAPNAPPPPLTFTTNRISTYLKVTPFFTFSLGQTPLYIYDYGLFISLFCFCFCFWVIAMSRRRAVRRRGLKKIWQEHDRRFVKRFAHKTLHLMRRRFTFPEDAFTEMPTLFTS
jgi:hypothetical protein